MQGLDGFERLPLVWPLLQTTESGEDLGEVMRLRTRLAAGHVPDFQLVGSSSADSRAESALGKEMGPLQALKRGARWEKSLPLRLATGRCDLSRRGHTPGACEGGESSACSTRCLTLQAGEGAWLRRNGGVHFMKDDHAMEPSNGADRHKPAPLFGTQRE